MSTAAAAAQAGYVPPPVHNLLEGAPASIANEKAALLALLAEHGTQGYQMFEQQKAEQAALRMRLLEEIGQRGAAVGPPRSEAARHLAGDFHAMMDFGAGQLLDSQRSYEREMRRLAAANAAYMDQAAAATGPLKTLLDAEIEKMRLAFEAARALAAGGGGRGGGGGGWGGGGGRGGGGGPSMPMPLDLLELPFVPPGGTYHNPDGSYTPEDLRFARLRPGQGRAPAGRGRVFVGGGSFASPSVGGGSFASPPAPTPYVQGQPGRQTSTRFTTRGVPPTSGRGSRTSVGGGSFVATPEDVRRARLHPAPTPYVQGQPGPRRQTSARNQRRRADRTR